MTVGTSIQVHPFAIEQDEVGICPGCVVVKLTQDNSPVVVLNHDLIRRIEATLQALPRTMTGFVLASASERVFIAGADLRAIQDLSDDQLDRYLAYGQRVFGMIASLPCPTVAAINGAALGGGLEIAMHCDALVAAPSPTGKPYPVGLPEAGLCICPGWGGTNLWPARIDPRSAIERTALGKPMLFDEAVNAGMFDRVAPSAADLLPAARSWIADARGGTCGPLHRRDGEPSRWIGRPAFKSKVTAALFAAKDSLEKTPSATAVLSQVETGLERGWQSALDAERRELVHLRSTPAGRSAIQTFFDKPKK